MGKNLDHQESSLSVISFHNRTDEDLRRMPDLTASTTKIALAAAGAGGGGHPLFDTGLPYKEHKFVMKIGQFSQRQGHKVVVKSTKACIDVGLSYPTKWCLLLYPNGNQEDREGFVSLYLYRWDKQETPVPATFTFAILNSYREKSFIVDVNEKKMFGHTPGNSKSLGAPKFVSRGDLFDSSWGLLEDDTLTVVCDLNVYSAEEDDDYDDAARPLVQFRNWVEELHFVQHPDEAAEKKGAHKQKQHGVSVGMFNPMRFLTSIDTWKKVETEV